MRTTSTFVAAGLSACGVLAAPAGLASADSAQDTINGLQAQGYTVQIDRVGSAPLNKCVVTSVRNPNTITQLVRTGSRRNGPTTLVPVILSKTISVSLDCSGPD
jgi:hypothetical protein